MRLIANYISLNIEFQNLLPFEVTLEVIIYMNGPYPNRRTCKDDVAGFKCEELTDKANQLIDAVCHIASKTTLYRLSVYIQMKMQILHITQRFKR